MLLSLFREADSFQLAKIDSICIARNTVSIDAVHCEVGDNSKIITATRKTVQFKRQFDAIRTRIRQEAVYKLQYGPKSPEYFVYFTNTHIYLDDDTMYPLHYFATDIVDHKTYFMFKGFVPKKEEKPTWL